MSDSMDFILAHIREQRGLPPALPHRGEGRFVCGGVISVRSLFVVVIEAKHGGGFNLIDHQCHEFELEDRSQAATRAFARDVSRLAWLAPSNCLVLRVAAQSGQYPASPFAYKIEAALQLVPNLDVYLVPTNSVCGWASKARHSLPEPDMERLGKSSAAIQLRAIEAAAFGHSHWNDARYFGSEV